MDSGTYKCVAIDQYGRSTQAFGTAVIRGEVLKTIYNEIKKNKDNFNFIVFIIVILNFVQELYLQFIKYNTL